MPEACQHHWGSYSRYCLDQVRVAIIEVKVTATFMDMLLSGQIKYLQTGVKFHRHYLSGWCFAIQRRRSPAHGDKPLSEFSRELLSHRISCCWALCKPLSLPHLLPRAGIPCPIPLALCQLASTCTFLMGAFLQKQPLFMLRDQLSLYSPRSVRVISYHLLNAYYGLYISEFI